MMTKKKIAFLSLSVALMLTLLSGAVFGQATQKSDVYRYLSIFSEVFDLVTHLFTYLSLPIRTYSTGMLVRLGFAASTASRPQILIMDEMIGAGDMAFADKAQARIGEYVADAHIMVLASHNNAILRQRARPAARQVAR